MASALLVIVAAAACSLPATAADRPNILWISAEDLSASTCGCYGGPGRTPRIDVLAAGGLRFDAAFAAAPVCAPSRSAIITGMMPTTLGSLPMRCRATPPPFVVGFPKLLREAGYYCTNNSKTDYNLTPRFDAGWDDSSRKAHWRNRPDPGRPFFAVFNLGVTHESGLFGDTPRKVRQSLPDSLRADPARVVVPGFYPDTPVIREALAQRLDLAAALDRDVGRILDELAADGLAESTIVVFWGDHGEGVPHGKRFLTEHGLRVPLLVAVPERFRARAGLPDGRPAAGVTPNLVSLMDLGPTMLDLAGLEAPPWVMEGRSFLGPHAAARGHVIGVADRMDAAPGFGRSVRDGRFRYLRNFLPWLEGDDLPDYAAGVPITGELRRVLAAGGLPPGADWFARPNRPAEELHDAVADPEEIRDLAGDTAHAGDLVRLRETLRGWMRTTRDTGILPEPLLRREGGRAGSEWAIFHPGESGEAAATARYDEILAAAWDVADQPAAAPWGERLASSDPAVRFWAVHGVGWGAARPGAAAAPDATASLRSALDDPEPVVRTAAAWWLLKLGTAERRPALDALARAMNSNDRDLRQQALVAIDQAGDSARSLWPEAAALELSKDEEYSARVVMRIRKRLGRP